MSSLLTVSVTMALCLVLGTILMSPPHLITTASSYNAHPGFSISPNSAHLDMYLPGVDYPEFSTLSNGSAPPDCLTVCSNGYTTPNMAWESSPQSTPASEALTRGAAPTNTHPPMVTEADSAHYCNSPELLLNSEVSTDHGPKLNSSLLKLLLTPKSTTGTSSSRENGHSTHITPSVTDAALKHHCQTVALQKTDQHDCQCAVHAVNGSSSSLVVTNGSVSTLGGHSAALGADTQLEDLLQQLF